MNMEYPILFRLYRHAPAPMEWTARKAPHQWQSRSKACFDQFRGACKLDHAHEYPEFAYQEL